jgi:hypothetical protein
MASNYNWALRPAVIMVKDGHARLIRRRETYDDLLACEVPENERPEMRPAAPQTGRASRRTGATAAPARRPAGPPGRRG